MDNQKWEKFIKEMSVSTNTICNDNSWSKKIEEDAVLRNKLLQILASDNDSMNRLNKRQINLVRKLLWELDLWKLQLPETFETLKFALFFKRMQICESCRMLEETLFEDVYQIHNLMAQPLTEEKKTVLDGFLYCMAAILVVTVVGIVLATY